MCGIFGGICIKDPESNLKLMGNALRHRGPDDEGYFIDGNIALGHRRLSIIDLAGGHQPMASSDGQYVIVYNGEIYNFREIREDLVKKGHTFRTSSDTEAILGAYREWGYDCLDRFNGMFAFALWDKGKRRLWLVRDRLGKKPLYLMSGRGMFCFSSEAKALRRLPFFNGTYDTRAIDQYLTFRYVPGERTFYKEIKKLPAGHWLLVDESGDIVQRYQWWKVPAHRDVSGGRTIQSYRDEFQSLFTSAVRLRLISDVPLGAFLSSGIDSVSIGVEMAKVSRPTFITISFGDEEDESTAAEQVAKELGGVHHVLRLHDHDFDLLPDAVASMDEPYGDPIILPTYILAKKAAEHVKVVLTGDGADEIMGGYVHQVFFRRMPLLPAIVRNCLATTMRAMPVGLLDRAFHYPASMGDAGRSRLARLLVSGPESEGAYLSFASLFSEAERKEFYAPDFLRTLANEPDEVAAEMQNHFSRKDIGMFDKVLQWDLRTWFSEQTLMKFDRLTMANSLEGRCPYADHRLVEFFFKLPLDTYSTFCDNKKLTRDMYQSARPYLPRKKKPFYLPMHRGFDARLKRFQEEVLASDEVKGFGLFRDNLIDSLRLRRESSPLLVDKQIMSLAILSHWLRSLKNRG